MKKGIMALALSMVIGVGTSVYVKASSATPNTTGTTSNVTCTGSGMGRTTGVRGYDVMSNLLKNKLGLTDQNITDALNSGKTMYDIAKEKGMSEENFKTAVLEEKSKSIDEAVTKGTLSKEDGDAIKTRVQENMENCTTPGEMRGQKGKGNGQGQGKGQGQGRGQGMGRNCSSVAPSSAQ